MPWLRYCQSGVNSVAWFCILCEKCKKFEACIKIMNKGPEETYRDYAVVERD